VKKLLSSLVALAAALFLAAPPASAQLGIADNRIPLAWDFDLDGLPTDMVNIVALVNLANGAQIVAGQPDIPKLLNITVVDGVASIVAGDVVIVGTDLEGDALTETVSVAAGAGTYPTLNRFRTVTSVTTVAVAVLGGAGDETISVGTYASTDYQYPVTLGRNMKFWDSRWLDGPNHALIASVGSSTTVTAVDATVNAFLIGGQVGDLLRFDLGSGNVQYRYVVTHTSDDAVILNAAIDLGTTGVQYQYRRPHVEWGPEEAWMPVANTWIFGWEISVAGTNVGGINYRVECTTGLPGSATVIVTGPTNVASGATAHVFYDNGDAWSYCRAGVAFGTSDDVADAVVEDIDIGFVSRGF
jgi:hypothetical protein